MDQTTWTSIESAAKAVWLAVAPVVTFIIGQVWEERRSTKRHKQEMQKWETDHKRTEYRELLESLTECRTALMIASSKKVWDSPTMMEAATRPMHVISTRLLIGATVSELDLLNRWGAIIQLIGEPKGKDGDGPNEFGAESLALLSEVQRKAQKDLNESKT